MRVEFRTKGEENYTKSAFCKVDDPAANCRYVAAERVALLIDRQLYKMNLLYNWGRGLRQF